MGESFQDYTCIQDFEADFLWKVSLKMLNSVDHNSFSDLFSAFLKTNGGEQWLSGRVLDSKLKDRGFEPHGRHYVVVLEQDTFILA